MNGAATEQAKDGGGSNLRRVPRDAALVATALALFDIASEILQARQGVAPLHMMIVMSWALVTLGAHLTLGLLLVRGLGRLVRRPRLVGYLGIFAFGLSWQHSIADRPGLVAHPYYVLLRGGLIVLTPLILVWLTSLVNRRARIPAPIFHGGLAVVIIAGLRGLSMLPQYRVFHAHLAVFIALLGVILLQPLRCTRRQGAAAGAAMGLGLLFLVTMGEGRAVEDGKMLRHAPATGAVAAVSPLGRALLQPLEHVIRADAAVPAELAREFLAERRSRRGSAAGPPRVRNVMLLVLESTRWDDWEDPAVAPHFARYRTHGTYFPAAEATYPGTSLAYGAMFTSQPASLLLATGRWRRQRLFDHLRPGIKHTIFSRPNRAWFEHTGLTNYFVAPGDEVHIHTDSRDALAYLRRRIVDAGAEPFFAWAHLFEPHSPYDSHSAHPFDTSTRGRYRSEVAAMDAALGEFMDWFRATGLGDSTLLLIVADHGEGFGEPAGSDAIEFHGFHLREVLTRIPFYIEAPGLEAGLASPRAVASQLDIMPTIFDALGRALPASAGAQGHSLLRLVEELPLRSLVSEQLQLDGHQFFALMRETHGASEAALRARFETLTGDPRLASKIALRRGNLKLIYDRMLRRSYLYDLGRDPHEHDDLATRQAPQVAEMHGHLERWIMRQAWELQRHD